MAYFKVLKQIDEKIKYWEECTPKNTFSKWWIKIHLCNLYKRKQIIKIKLQKLKNKNQCFQS
jgi:hypothetical protein